MKKYGVHESELKQKANETDAEYARRMYDLSCKFYDYIGW